MSKETRSPFKIRNVKDSTGWYSSDYLSLARDAIESLAELEAVTEEVKQNWPLPLGETIREPRLYPEIKVLAARRDRLSMATLIFSAMAVEAFLNYYGVLRIGEAAYTKHFERRLSMVEKLSVLLLVCDGIAISGNDELLVSIRTLTNVRNSVVHPKTKEMDSYVPGELRDGLPVPDAAREAVKSMKQFFIDFVRAVPDAEHMLPERSH